jgi:hypothetical protein
LCIDLDLLACPRLSGSETRSERSEKLNARRRGLSRAAGRRPVHLLLTLHSKHAMLT